MCEYFGEIIWEIDKLKKRIIFILSKNFEYIGRESKE